MSENDVVAHFTDVYRNVCSIPNPVGARYFPLKKNHFIIESFWSNHDFAKLLNTSFTRSYFGHFSGTTEVSASVIHDDTSANIVAFSNSGNMCAILREEKNANLRQIIEIWNKDRKLKSYDILEMKQHGKIYDDGFLGTLTWNDAEDTLLYVAENFVSKSISYFKQLPDCKVEEEATLLAYTKGEEYTYRENWGETYVDKSHSVLCTLKVHTGEITILPLLQNDRISLCQPIWSHGDKSIFFVGYFESPFRLGLKFCLNRLSKIYRYEFSSEDLYVVSNENVNSRSPRLSPDNQVLIYIQNERNGPHNTCCQLMKYGVDGKQVVVDIVKCGVGAAFPGIYTECLPERCFSSNGRYVIFSSIWRSGKVILTVDLKTNSVQRIPVDSALSSCTVLDVFDDVVVASACSPNIEPFLIAGKLCFENDFVTVLWTSLDPESPHVISGVDWSIQSLEPPVKNDNYPNLDFESILLMPRNSESSVPLILCPHGGPHSVFTASFCEYHVAFVKLGYAVCLINYRGSIGFGQDNIYSLLGNIGTQDVDDVYYALQCARQNIRLSTSDVFLFGGSHGGFLVTHLSARYPDEFAACVCRNPVIDIACMVESTDIPDWPWVECGLVDTFNYTLPDRCAMIEMWDKSPIKFVNLVRVPTLLLLGKQDRRVPSTQGLKYYRALKCNNVPVKLCMYEDNHGFVSFVAQSDGFMQTMMWFHKYQGKI